MNSTCYFLVGILALARQWKTVLVGAEGVENIFATSYQVPKKPVVGRGDLPPDALKFLLKEARASDSNKIHQHEDIELDVLNPRKGKFTSNHKCF